MQVTTCTYAYVIYKVRILLEELSNLLCSYYLRYIQRCWNSSLLHDTCHYRTCGRNLYLYIHCSCRRVNCLDWQIFVQSLESRNIHLIPLLSISYQIDGHTIGDNQILCLQASGHILHIGGHIHAKLNLLICGQFNVDLVHIVADELLHHIEDEAWHTQWQVNATWNTYTTLRSNIILTTYGSTHGHLSGLTTYGCKAEFRQVAHLSE